MTSKHFFALGMVGAGLLVMGAQAGCGGGSGTGGSTAAAAVGAGAATATSTTSTKGPASVVSSTSVSTGAGGSGGTGGSSPATNTSFASASPIMVGAAATMGMLPDAMTQLYYSFSGTAGDFVLLQALAQGLVMGTPTMPHDPNDPTVTDTVVTLYLPDMSTIWAQDDDAWPRLGTDSTLFTQLPMTGTYYFTVEDCNGYAATHPGVTCAPAANITNFTFSIFVGDLTATKSDAVGTTAGTTLAYKVPMGNKPGQYGTDILDGDFAAQSDVHVFNFTPPSNTTSTDAAHTRNRAYFWVQPYGAGDGDGTAIDVVLTAKDMGGHVLATSDQQFYTNGDDPMNGAMQFSFPLDDQFANKLGSPFVLDVAVSNKTALQPMKSFYSIEHFEGGFYYSQPEAEGPLGTGMNDTAMTAQTLTSPTGVTGGYFIDGNLSSATDVDWFSIPTIPSGLGHYYITCQAGRDGSGLQGFTAKLQTSKTGAAGPFTMASTLGPETANAKTELQSAPAGTAIPAGATSVWLEVSATGQSATNMGTYYRCEIDLVK